MYLSLNCDICNYSLIQYYAQLSKFGHWTVENYSHLGVYILELQCIINFKYLHIYSLGQHKLLLYLKSDKRSIPKRETNSETSLSDHQGVPQGFESDYPNQTESELVASHAEGGMLKPLTTKAENAPRFTINTIPVSISRSGQLARGGLRHSVFPNLAENSSMLNRSYVPKYVDSTGCFHWVPDTSIEKVKLVSL